MEDLQGKKTVEKDLTPSLLPLRLENNHRGAQGRQLRIKNGVLDAGCWVLDARHWMLGWKSAETESGKGRRLKVLRLIVIVIERKGVVE